MKIRTLIVDDELWARRRIATLLKAEPDIEIVGECPGGVDAIKQIGELSPDVVFLDVQMPDADGFEVLEAVDPEHMPLVIFATAYDKYALQAFDAQALDYLLKPFDEDRFRKALDRARKDMQNERTAGKSLLSLLDRLRDSHRFLQRLVVKSGGRVTFLKSAEIDWFQATGNYVTLHVGRDSHLLRMTISALESKLDSGQFIRIQRSTIVNLDRIKELQPWTQGEQIVVLKDGTQLSIGRAFRGKLDRLLQNATE